MLDMKIKIPGYYSRRLIWEGPLSFGPNMAGREKNFIGRIYRLSGEPLDGRLDSTIAISGGYLQVFRRTAPLASSRDGAYLEEHPVRPSDLSPDSVSWVLRQG